jgi:hypothetical protein
LPGEQITLTLTDAGGTSHTYFGQTGSIDGSYTFSQLPTGTGEILLGNSYNCFGNFNSPFTVTVSSGTNTRNFTGIPNSRTATGTVTFPDNNPVAVNVRAHRDTPTGVVDDYAGLEPDRTTFHLQLYCDWSGYAEPYLVNPPNDAFIFEPANKHVDVLDNVNIGEFVAITNVSITEPLAGVNWNSGSSQTIRWTSCTNCDVSSQDVLLSPDGSTWQTLASGLAPSIRTLDWTVDGVPSSQCRVKIVAHRASGATRENTSGIFSISSLSVGGFFPYEVWRIDRPHTVTWTYAGVSVGSFDLLVGKDVAGPWTTLATALPAATRSLDWTPDATWIGVAYFKVIARASGGTSLIESVSHFVRVDCFDVMVTSPTPGSYESGMSMQIQSSVDGSCGSVTYTYSVSRDGGATFSTIGTNTSGLLNWVITPPASSTCKIMVEAQSEMDADVGYSGTFTIATSGGGGGDCHCHITRASALGLPLTTRLLGAYPNPFRPPARIQFSLAKPADVDFVVYDARGARTTRSSLGERAAGNWEWSWDGKTDRGAMVPSGVYFVELRVGGILVDRVRAILLR